MNNDESVRSQTPVYEEEAGPFIFKATNDPNAKPEILYNPFDAPAISEDITSKENSPFKIDDFSSQRIDESPVR